MDATILDLRYKMRNVLSALNRREKVRILYHGKVKGEIIPSKSNNSLRSKQHEIFGMLKGEKGAPEHIVAMMRRCRNRDF
jgi:hypothetical protein